MVAKGYSILSQKVSINVNLNGTLNGYTELTITPTAPDLKVIYLNAQSMKILTASLRVPTVVPLAFSHSPPAPATLTEPSNIHTYPELKRALWRASNEGEEGELGIAVPQGCIVKVGGFGENSRTPAQTPRAAEEGGKKDKGPPADEFEQIVIAIEYEVAKPGLGITVVRPDEANPSRFPHVFTSSSSDIAARTWVPCSDYSKDRCTWELEFTVPRALYSGTRRRTVRGDDEDEEMPEDEDHADEEEEEEEWPVTVAASGELVEQVVHPNRSDRVVWHFIHASAVSVHHIAWAVGPFVVMEILPAEIAKPAIEGDEGRDDGVEGAGGGREGEEGADGEAVEEEEETVQPPKDEGPKLHALCLPGRQAEMAHSVGIIRQAMDFYTASFGSYPFTTYTVAFVDSLASGNPTFHSAATTLFSSDLLHPPTIIDQAYETRQALAHALAVQWSGINLIPRTPSDNWLVIGIAFHMTSLFLKSLWGNNEYRFRLKKDMIRCVAQDVQREPMSVPARHTQPEPDQMQFIALKAPLVLHILDKHLRKSGTSLGLDKVLPKIFLDAIMSDPSSGNSNTYNTLSTNSFQRTCRKACGGSSEALSTFFDQWVYGSGCPTFIVAAQFARKKMAIEIKVTQDCRAANWAQSAPYEEAGHLRAMKGFEGLMTIRVHEADGTPYEHVLNISGEELNKTYEVPFNTKYKRVRRNTKRYQARQAAATAAANGDTEAQEAMGLVDLGFALSLWEDEAERERWRVADWTEEEDEAMSQATYEWIRIDAELDWICAVNFTQPEHMWVSQLQRDRDVVAQLEAVHALSRMPTPVVSSTLTKTILVSNYYFRIRMEACLALVACATPAQNYLGLFHLLKLFQTRYCFDPETETHDPFAFRCIPRTNNFSDISDYFLKKSLITAISMVRDDKGQTPPVVQQCLLDLLSYNDNLGNQFSDTFYLANVMIGLGHSFVAVAATETGQFTESQEFRVKTNEYLAPALQEVERYMSADRLDPSYHNAITVAGIEWKLKLTLACLIPEDRKMFLCYTRDGNYPAVRIAAFEALLLFNPFNDMQSNAATVTYMFSVSREDSSLLVQRRLAQAMLHSIPILAAIGDLAASETVFEEDGAVKKSKESVSDVLKALRKRPGRSVMYRNLLLSILANPAIDTDVRWSILKLCESTSKAGEEPIPKMRLKMSTGVAESPAPVPLPSPAVTRITLAAPAAAPALPKIPLVRLSTAGSTPLATPSSELPPVSLPETPAAPAKPKKVKVKPPPKLDPAQASGMEMYDVTSCRSLLKKLLKDKNSMLFRHPVDPVKSGAPGYFDVIKNPMDLSTMAAKLQSGSYKDRKAFRADFDLVMYNAELYNKGNDSMMLIVNKLTKSFNKHWERIEATLLQMGTTNTLPAAGTAATAPTAAPAVAAPSSSPAVVKASAPPTAPARSVSFKLTVPTQSSPPAPSPLPSLPAPEPVKAAGFKITLGGSSMAPPPLPSPSSTTPIPAPAQSHAPVTTAAPISGKPPKPAKMVKSASHADDVEFAKPALPSKPKAEKVKSDKPKIEKAAKVDKFEKAPKAEKVEKAVKVDKVERIVRPDKVEKIKGDGTPKLNPDGTPKVKKKAKDKAKVNYDEDAILPPPEEFLLPPPPPLESPDLPAVPPPEHFISPTKKIDIAKAKGVIAKMRAAPESFFFREPVIAEGALSTYYDEITDPMDLQTMEDRLVKGEYHTYGSIFAAFQLIVKNCLKFNPVGTQPVAFVYALDRQWRLEWQKASKLSFNVKRALASALKTLMADGAAFPFLESITTIPEIIPSYEAMIPRKDWRDLGTIRQWVQDNRYSELEEVDADVQLMLKNCFTFNPPGSPVYGSGELVAKMWKAALSKVRSETKTSSKRAGEPKAGGASKKQKL